MCFSIGWHDNKLLPQQPPHRSIRVHEGKTKIVGSVSDSSLNLSGTTVTSGMQAAGIARDICDRSTSMPANRADLKIKRIGKINSYNMYILFI